MRFEGKRVCVTGAGGFIAFHLIARLLERGAEVVAVGRLGSEGRRRLATLADRVELVPADVGDPRSLEAPLRRADVVYHLAAMANPRDCARDLPGCFSVNVEGTLNVLRAAAHAQRFVFFSTAYVYGEPDYLPLDEQHRLKARHPYAASKIMAEQLVRTCHDQYGLPYTIVRNANLFGPGQSRDYLVPSLILQGLTAPQIEIWDTRPIRDFLYVEDAAEAFVRVVESEATANETVNVGSGRGISTGELADLIAETLKTSWVDVQKPVSTEGKLVCDIRLLGSLCGWHPRIPLQEGLRRTADYYRGSSTAGASPSDQRRT
jgi:dTDP-glucose 4,6-dehydratase